MGQLTVQLGPITGTRSFQDAAGQVTLEKFIKAYNGGTLYVDNSAEEPVEMTAQQKMNMVISLLTNHVIEAAWGYDRREAERAAREAANAAPPTLE